MKIFRPNSTEIDIVVNDDANCYISLMDIGTLTLTFSLGHFEEFNVGCYAEFEGIRYFLTKPENVTMKHSRNFEYTLTMFDLGYLLDTFKLRNSIDKRLKFSMTAKPVEILTEIVKNINDRSTFGWVIGDCVDGVEQTLTFSHNSVKEALNMLCEALKTEYYLTFGDKITIHVKKAEFNKADCPKLSYSCGNGFLSGVKRDCDTSSQEIFRLYVQGGESNIDFSIYGSPYLLLPAKGVCDHEDRTYKVSNDRYYIYNEEKGDIGYESSFDCPEVYPNRVGSVTKVEQEKTFYNIVDESIPETLDYKECIMPGESLTLNFKSGMLAGRDIEASYEKAVNDMGNYYGGRFKLVPQDYDGVNMPSGVFVPKQGDEYTVFGVSLPKIYIDDAEVKLLKESAKNMYENEFQKYNFTGELDAIYLKNNWGLLGSKIVVGGYIIFTAPFTKKEGEKIRITGLKRYINDRYKIELTLSNGVASTSLGTILDRVENIPTIVEGGDKKTRQFAKRRYEDAIKTAEMLSNALLDKFTDGIMPITVQTMQMIVGSPQLQFGIYDYNGGDLIDFPLTWNKGTKTLTVEPFTMMFYEPTKDLTTFKKELWWECSSSIALVIGDDKSHIPYYVYIECLGEGNNSQDYTDVVISETALPYFNTDTQFRYLLVGILNSEYEGERYFAPMYGFTEITPDRVTTNRVVSHDGMNYFDMVNNAMQLKSKKGNSRLTWKNGALDIVGTIKQLSGDGQVYEIGVFKGEYNDSTTYCKNDEVTYTFGGEVCTYRYYYNNPTSGNLPTDSNFWKIVARGAIGLAGKDGAGFEFIFRCTAIESNLTTPTSVNKDGDVPKLWTNNQSGVNAINTCEYVCTRSKYNGNWGLWSSPKLWAKYAFNGIPGIDGKDYEFIYKLTNSANAPEKPIAINQNDNDIPTGWTDNPTGVNAISKWEWVSKRQKNGGVWSHFSIPALWSKFGEDGTDGKNYEFIFKHTVTNVAPVKPKSIQEDDNIPDGWSDNAQGVSEVFPYEWTCKRFKFNGIWDGYSSPALWAKYSSDGKPGDDGRNGSPIVFRGEWNTTDMYYGLHYRLDVVKYNGTYYVADSGAGEFKGQMPNDSSLYWNNFGAQFSSVATGLLIAEMANIAGWNFYNDIIKSQNNTLFLDGRNSEFTINESDVKLGKFDRNGLTLYGDKNKPLRSTVKIVPGDIEEIDNIGTKSEKMFLGHPKNDVIRMQAGTRVTMSSGKVFVQVKAINEIVRYSITLSSGGYSITSSVDFRNENNQNEEFDVPVDLTQEILTVGSDGKVTIEVSHTDNVISANFDLTLKFENSYGTVIGKNGMYSFMGNNRYFYISENQPPTMRNGNFGLMISDNGIMKWNGSNWVEANI